MRNNRLVFEKEDIIGSDNQPVISCEQEQNFIYQFIVLGGG